MSRLYILDVGIDLLTEDQVLLKAEELFSVSFPTQIVSANPLLVLKCQNDATLRAAVDRADYVLNDSIGLSWAALQIGRLQLPRIPGIDLAFSLCEKAAELGFSVYLLGGAPGIAPQAAGFLRRSIPNVKIAGEKDGFFDEAESSTVIETIKTSGAKLVLVAMGMPKQDLWISANKSQFSGGLYMGVGGTLDVWAGRVLRAPQWMQKIGLEWFFRLISEPSRIFRMSKLPLFALKVVLSSKK